MSGGSHGGSRAGSRGAASWVALLALLSLVLGAWLVWPRLSARFGSVERRGASPVASAEIADAALDRFETFRAGKGGDHLTLSDAELSSVVRYALPGLLPSGVTEPLVTMNEGRLTLAARVATEAFPRLPTLDAIVGMLPDTVTVTMDGELVPFGKESLAFRVGHMDAASIPLPDRLIPGILTALGRKHRGGLPPNALQVPLPTGLDSVSVRGDSLVLVAGP